MSSPPSVRVSHLSPLPQPQQLLHQLLPLVPATPTHTVVGPPVLVSWPAKLPPRSRSAVPQALFAKETASWMPHTFARPEASSAPFFDFVCLKPETVSRVCLSWSGSGEPCGGGAFRLKGTHWRLKIVSRDVHTLGVSHPGQKPLLISGKTGLCLRWES